MSYARFSADSDVYVFLNTGGYLDCCYCSLSAAPRTSFRCATVTDMVDHLAEHVAAGDKVEPRVFGLLEIERDAIAAYIDGHDFGEALLKLYRERGVV